MWRKRGKKDLFLARSLCGGEANDTPPVPVQMSGMLRPSILTHTRTFPPPSSQNGGQSVEGGL